MNVKETRAQIRVVGPCPFEKYEEEANKALDEMKSVFIVQTETIVIDRDTVYSVILYKETV